MDKIIEEILENNMHTLGGWADYGENCNFDKKGALEELISLFNSHYIAKEKVLGLKLSEREIERKLVSYQGGGIGTITWETQKTDGYNRAVSEINNAIDSLVGDNK